MIAQDICGHGRDGKFLVRQRDTYSLTDATLKLRPYIEVPTPVFETEVLRMAGWWPSSTSMNDIPRSNIEKFEAQAVQYGESPPAEDTQITLIDIRSREVLAALQTESPIKHAHHLHRIRGRGRGTRTANSGFASFHFRVGVNVLGKVASTLHATRESLNPKALFIESCVPNRRIFFSMRGPPTERNYGVGVARATGCGLPSRTREWAIASP